MLYPLFNSLLRFVAYARNLVNATSDTRTQTQLGALLNSPTVVRDVISRAAELDYYLTSIPCSLITSVLPTIPDI